MKAAMSSDWMTAEQDQRITETVRRERTRLRNFIRRRVRDEGDAEDILQDVFSEFVEAYRLMKRLSRQVRGCSGWPGTGLLTGFAENALKCWLLTYRRQMRTSRSCWKNCFPPLMAVLRPHTREHY